MAINMGALVTLLVTKEHPDGEELTSGVSGMVVQTNPNQDGSIRYVVDFGPEGQWNCEEGELLVEGSVQRHSPGPKLRPLPGGASLRPVPVETRHSKNNEDNPDKVLSFEEEMALLGED